MSLFHELFSNVVINEIFLMITMKEVIYESRFTGAFKRESRKYSMFGSEWNIFVKLGGLEEWKIQEKN